MTLRLDYSCMLAENVQGALDESAMARGREAYARARAVFRQQREQGALGFLDLVDGAPKTAELRAFAEGIGQAFSDVVVLGIGGSALGAIALRGALCSPVWNALSDEQREFFPRLHVLDNVDPDTMASLLERIRLGSTLFVVISKSGGTAETMAQYLIVREKLEAELGESYRRHLVFITDPERGALRRIAGSERIVSLDVPPNVGGRFSVLSPVGLLPAALIGIDVDALLTGAAEMAALSDQDDVERSPAGLYAMLQWLADSELGLRNHVLMPYSDRLRDFADWFVQLWAESLGKISPQGGGVGPTPIAAVGVTDQHSQVQLFMEGPRDKTVTFVSVATHDADVPIPRLHADIPEVAYLGGHSLGTLLEVERRATAGALAQRGRPSMTLELERVDAWHLGALIMFFQVATVLAGDLYGVDPLDQPGVELGKRFTYAMLDRPDAAAARREWAAVPERVPRWVP